MQFLMNYLKYPRASYFVLFKRLIYSSEIQSYREVGSNWEWKREKFRCQFTYQMTAAAGTEQAETKNLKLCLGQPLQRQALKHLDHPPPPFTVH